MNIRMLAIAASVALGFSLVMPTAQAKTTVHGFNSVQSGITAQCGFHTEWVLGSHEAHYLHCTNQPYAVWVEVDWRYKPNELKCVQPNQDAYLGLYDFVGNAWYTGRLC
ncbi:DUF6355 family natural product biosynthesis protein [Nonomuraea recticatena]|uniref:Secreted protein n=1 Tax=Nonomuraea recticatena TaxID=46178 RepID=A0ABP6FXP6_9ACTN